MKSQNAPVIVLAVVACTLPSSAHVQDVPTDVWKKAGADEGLRQGDYVRTKPLVIDPVLVYSTFGS